MNRRGVSPVVATILLISVTLVIAVIVFVAFMSLIGEKTQKFGEPVENSCDKISFDAEASDNGVRLINKGTIPIAGIKLRTEGDGSSTLGELEISDDGTITSGATGSFDVSISGSATAVYVVPVILGQVNEETKYYTCEEQGTEVQ